MVLFNLVSSGSSSLP